MSEQTSEHTHDDEAASGGTERIEADWAFIVMSKGERLIAFGNVDNALLTHPMTDKDVILTSKAEATADKIKRACLEVADDVTIGQITQQVVQVQMQMARQAAMAAEGKTESGLVVPPSSAA